MHRCQSEYGNHSARDGVSVGSQSSFSTLYPLGFQLGLKSARCPDRLGRRGDMTDDSAEILFEPFQREAFRSNSGMGRVVDVVNPVFPPPPTASPTRQGCPEGMVSERMEHPFVSQDGVPVCTPKRGTGRKTD